ncbi:hypothetical protein QUB68_24640 [Microcoleus sp. A006_D1]
MVFCKRKKCSRSDASPATIVTLSGATSQENEAPSPMKVAIASPLSLIPDFECVNEVSQLSARDCDPVNKTLRIWGKGRGIKSEVVDLGAVTVQAIADWLEVKPIRAGETDPLFTALDFPNWDIG